MSLFITVQASSDADMFHPGGHEYESQEYYDERQRKRYANTLLKCNINLLSNRAGKMKGKEFNRRG